MTQVRNRAMPRQSSVRLLWPILLSLAVHLVLLGLLSLVPRRREPSVELGGVNVTARAMMIRSILDESIRLWWYGLTPSPFGRGSG